jgi:hypothetical protein
MDEVPVLLEVLQVFAADFSGFHARKYTRPEVVPWAQPSLTRAFARKYFTITASVGAAVSELPFTSTALPRNRVVGEARVTQSFSLVLAGLSIVSALSCSVLDGPRQASISLVGARTVMVGDVVHLTAEINGAIGATSEWNASDFRELANVGETNTSVDVYGVGVGEGWVRLSLEERNAGGSLIQIAKDSIPITVTAPPPSKPARLFAD